MKKAANIFTNFFCCGVMLLVWLLCGVCSLSTLLLGEEVSYMGITDPRMTPIIALVVTVGLFLVFAVSFVKGLFWADKSQWE
ncbi:MAG: hypothetical protein ACOYYS_06175 [Chloroflexota bacterium]